MSRSMRTYYYALLGAIGGLIGSQVSNLLGLSFAPVLYVSEIVVGVLIGLSVGLLIGVAEGVTGRTQMWKGALGGFIGGLLGGALLEAAQRAFNNPLAGKDVGLVMLGAAVGAFIALITVLLSRAWLEVVSGKLKGSEFILDKFMQPNSRAAIIGNDALKADNALPDPDIQSQHALLTGTGTHFALKDISLQGTRVNNRKIEQVTLFDGARIRMDNTEMVYHEKR